MKGSSWVPPGAKRAPGRLLAGVLIGVSLVAIIVWLGTLIV